MKFGIVCDRWKVPIFKQELDRDGFFDYEYMEGPGKGVSTFTVETERANAIHETVKRANALCAGSR